MSERRIAYREHRAGLAAMQGLERAVHDSGLDRSLLELVKMRASQISECAFCLDMHWKDARANGETEQRLYGLSAWREAPYYSDRERAALALTDAVTLIAREGVPDALIEAAEGHFAPEELQALLFAIVTINAWNRLAIAGRSPAGSYQPARRP